MPVCVCSSTCGPRWL
ncbi:hypothetical protein LEMLEM_LOCUS11884 [Lemmus lemmus]